MSIVVRTIDKNKARGELKKCPKVVRDYVRSLEGAYEANKVTLQMAIKKLKEKQV